MKPTCCLCGRGKRRTFHLQDVQSTTACQFSKMVIADLKSNAKNFLKD
jgi:hypothetical protein